MESCLDRVDWIRQGFGVADLGDLGPGLTGPEPQAVPLVTEKSHRFQ